MFEKKILVTMLVDLVSGEREQQRTKREQREGTKKEEVKKDEGRREKEQLHV